MRFARVGRAGEEVPVVVDAKDQAFRLDSSFTDLDAAFLTGGGIDLTRAALAAGQLEPIDISGMRFGPPVPTPTLLMCIGLNYRNHVIETNAEMPSEPVLFMKSPRTIIGANDPVIIPPDSEQTDWEVELAIVIGKRAHLLKSPQDAVRHIAGYAISNDVSERSYQLEHGGQWCKGKSCDTFNPLGPYLVPRDEVDPSDLDLSLAVNGEVHQKANTSDMIFDVNFIVWYVSRFMALDAGDVINTGTPAGIALGSSDLEFLRPGDSMEVQISGLGSQCQKVSRTL